MAETLPTPRATPEVEEKMPIDIAGNHLEAALDELLKRYLLLLDQYTQARQQLSSDLSSGYISLAQANFNPSSRVRYGQDFYDERMQALRRVTIGETESKLHRSIRLLEPPEEPTSDETKTKTADATDNKKEGTDKNSTEEAPVSVAELSLDPDAKNTAESPEAQPGEAREPPGSNVDGNGNKRDDSDKIKEKEKASKKPRTDDPIRWFGIFVPPALRSAQGSFIRAVEGPVPRLLDLAAEMRELEIEIGRARKAIRKSAN
ncbi:uncharacterized protein LTHEOB_8778 [Lasiodiplodia theobromae]|uniref:uncharacterized protein n=1 Tax=Lasiodiplodia theobromae TaxID=45133 RepID=UPI0015C3810C|nr:uncharacterized protein LTHEOB_8778 [Lasiodiplodia theobromae]KAF4541382.1 hypothetical protein LTHEOB_8778 [Lasiodiplodia theobromae]